MPFTDRPFTLYDVFAPRALPGGKRVAVFDAIKGDLQAQAAQAGVPLSVFVQQADAASLNPASLRLSVFTPTREKGESDSATVAALTHLQPQLLDMVQVKTGTSETAAQLCGGEWLLQQGVVTVGEAQADLGPLALAPAPIYTAATTRPNLVVEVGTLAVLDSFKANAEAIAAVNTATQTTGLILYTPERPSEGQQRRADVCFRAFGPLKGFLEDAASSNMLACLTGVLGARGLLPSEGNLLRAAQRMLGQPALLTAQFGAADEAVWVGGGASVVASAEESSGGK